MKPRLVPTDVLDSGMRRQAVYTIDLSDEPRGSFTPAEKEFLRPIAETLAMLDGNAFFSHHLDDGGTEWYEQYLPEAWVLFTNNGGLDGWSGETGWLREWRLRDENPMLQSLWEQYQTALRMAREDRNG